VLPAGENFFARAEIAGVKNFQILPGIPGGRYFAGIGYNEAGGQKGRLF
jgi:hypothetical protein